MTAEREAQASSVRALFNAKAAAWSSKYRARGPLAWRISAFLETLAPLASPPARVLDFGCGTGDLADALSQRDYRVTGCDIADGMVTQSRKAFGDRVEWITLDEDWSRLPFPDGAFDVVVASSVLEYVPDTALVLRECGRVLRERGVLLATVPNMAHSVRYLERFLAVVGRTAVGASVERRGGSFGSYVRYLRLSKNRFDAEAWGRAAAPYGFSVERLQTHGALLLISFRRR